MDYLRLAQQDGKLVGFGQTRVILLDRRWSAS